MILDKEDVETLAYGAPFSRQSQIKRSIRQHNESHRKRAAGWTKLDVLLMYIRGSVRTAYVIYVHIVQPLIKPFKGGI